MNTVRLQTVHIFLMLLLKKNIDSWGKKNSNLPETLSY